MTKYDSFLAALLGFNPTNRVFALTLFSLYYKSLDGQRDHFYPEQRNIYGVDLSETHTRQASALRRLSLVELGEKRPDFDVLRADAISELVNKGYFVPHPSYPDQFQPTPRTKIVVETTGEFAWKYAVFVDGKASAADLSSFKTAAEALATEKRDELLAGTISSGELLFHNSAERLPLIRQLDGRYKAWYRENNPFGFGENIVLSEPR